MPGPTGLTMETCHRLRGRLFGVSPVQVVGAAAAGGRGAVSLAIAARIPLCERGNAKESGISSLFPSPGWNSTVSEHVVIAVGWACLC